MNKNRFDEIAKKAYDIYEKSGWVHGRDFENWLEAEKIVVARYIKNGISGAEEKVEKAAKAASRAVKKEIKGAVSGLKSAAKGLKKVKTKQA